MNGNFIENMDYGKVWEDKFLNILNLKLDDNIKIIDQRGIINPDSKYKHRDDKNRAVPDFRLVNLKNHTSVMYDAKRKSAYKGKTTNFKSLFTLDDYKIKSYRSIAEEFNMKVYLAYWDDKNDPDHYYIIDCEIPEYDIYNYNNEYGTLSYRWDKENAIKRKIPCI